MSAFDTPFHDGELALQARAGVMEKIARFGQRAIRSVLTEEHREFFAELPYLFLASLDEKGRPWASMVWGAPGFATSPEPTSLQVRGVAAAGDPLASQLAAGAPLGVLGIQLETRRRNRASGIVTSHEGSTFSLRITQSFGNCQKYIQVRRVELRRKPDASVEGAVVRERALLSAEARRMLCAADTAFIASRSAQPHEGGGGQGLDVSHRGGLPGFLHVGDDGVRTRITLPDYTGNFLFNTLGNLQQDARAGLLVVDFESGSLLSLTGTARVLWDGAEVRRVPGAQRLVQIDVAEGLRLDDVLPFKWSEALFAPQLAALQPSR